MLGRRIQRDGQAASAVDDRLHGRGDRARVGHIVAEVGVRVDARNDQVDLFLDHAQQRQRHAVGGRAVAGQRGGTVRKHSLADSQGAVQGLDVARGAPVTVGREHGHPPQVAHLLRQGQQTRRLDPVVVGHHDVEIAHA